MDVLLLSRLQFALTIMFHYLFPPLTIGMSVVLVYLMAMHLRTGQAIYDTAAKFWTRIFGLNFALGVASGIVMEFQFGTNWAAYSRYVGDVFGSALAAEGIFAFFLESGFLAVLIFGWDRVSKRMHLFAAVMVCVGSIFSSVWIVVANSWQQTPAGFHVVAGRAEITDFWAMVFNPSTMHRLVHVWIGAFILGGFFVMSISAWYLLKGRHMEFARRSFTGALVLAGLASLGQLASGHLQAQNVAEHQPAKLAAFEGHFADTGGGAPMYLFGWPDQQARQVKYGLAIPGGLSWLIHQDASKPVPGLAETEEAGWGSPPPVWLTFQSYHLMVALGMLFIGLTLLALVLRVRGTLWNARWLLWVFVLAVIPAFIANEVGWVAAEVGRQPWSVYPTLEDGVVTGGLLTADSVSNPEVVAAAKVMASIVMFLAIYALLFAVWVYVLNHKIQRGPEPPAEDTGAPPTPHGPDELMAAASATVDRSDSLTDAGTPTR
jgi:cytochrome d ubiquinol oxidase subunit I